MTKNNTYKKQFSQVKEFMQACEQEIKTSPNFPDKKTVELRLNLIQEEVSELAEAINENDTIEVIDAFVDILYVTYGTCLSFGLEDDFYKAREILSTISENDLFSKARIILKTLYHALNGLRGAFEEESLGETNYYLKTIINIICLNFKTEPYFDEVHFSNMTKVVDGKVLKNEFGKVMKPITYKAPELNIVFDKNNGVF